MAMWTKDFLLEFIELFCEHEVLWKVKSKDYSNKMKREENYDILVAKMKEIDPAADRNKVQKKINNIRTVFCKEHKKVLQSLVSGSGADDTYVPKLWYYNNLIFLKDQEEPCSSTASSLSDDTQSTYDNNEHTEDTQSDVQSPRPPSCTEHMQSETPSPRPTTPISPSTSIFSSPQTNTFKRKKDTAVDKAFESISKRLNQIKEDDKFDIFGKNVAFKLRGLPDQQRIIAEKIINDTLFEAEMNNLNKYCGLRVVNSHYVSGPETNFPILPQQQLLVPTQHHQFQQQQSQLQPEGEQQQQESQDQSEESVPTLQNYFSNYRL